MFIRVKKKDESRFSVQIVEAVREGRLVRQKILRHIGVAHNDKEINELKKVAEFIRAQIEEERQPKLFPPEELAQLAIKNTDLKKANPSKQEDANQPLIVDLKNIEEEGRYVVGIHEIYGRIFDELHFNTILPSPSRHKAATQIIKNLVCARIANPTSKRDTVFCLETDFGISLNLDAVYRTMDQLDDQAIERIKQCSIKSMRQLFQEKVDVLFYDCTTLYFEAFEEDDLRRNGYSKDLKFNQPQVLLAMCVTKEGIPVSYELFPGNVYEGHTLITAMTKLKERFSLDKVVLVADSGLLNADNLNFLKENGFYYIVGARLKNTPQALQEKILNQDLYCNIPEDQEKRILSIEMPSKAETLIVHYSHARACKDHHDRLKAVTKLRKKLDKVKDSKSYLSNYGYKKYLKVDGTQTLALDEEKIAQDSKWDGLHGVVTNIDWMSPQDIVAQYKGLWQVEESFRIQKHDLKVRPIFHWKEERVKAHIALCYMAFTCVRHLEYRIKTQYQKLSPEVIRRELVHVQETLYRDKATQKRYSIPSKMGVHAEKIYHLMGISRNRTPRKL